MKIAFILDEEWDSALTHYAYGVYKALKNGNETVVFCLRNGYIDEIHKGEKVYVDRLRQKNPIKSILVFRHFAKQLRAVNPDIVITIRGDAAFFACLLKKSINFRLIRIFGENKKLRTPRECIDKLILPADFLKQKIDLRKVKDIAVVRGFVDADKFIFSESARKRIRERYGVSENEILFGSVGRLDPVKGYPMLIRAFSRLKKDSRLMIVGEEKNISVQELNKLIDDLDLISSVIVVNERRDDIADIMSAFDVGVVPSVASETIARVMLEFMSVGLPVVASNVGMLKEIAEEDFSIICKPDEESLFQAMQTMAQGDWDKMKDNALNSAKKYSFNNFRSQILSILDST